MLAHFLFASKQRNDSFLSLCQKLAKANQRNSKVKQYNLEETNAANVQFSIYLKSEKWLAQPNLLFSSY